ncbi:MAG TPA: response regulator, partial [Chloroflexota bacterium]|nr:response regulator [Chloroflexota bacterium]
MEHPERARVLIVDDHRANVLLLESILRRAGFSALRGTTDPAQALPIFLEFAPDIVLLDLHMPGIDGYTLLERIRSLTQNTAPVPVIVLTADATPEAKQRVLAGGAKDFLNKPFDQAEVVLRIRNHLETRFLHLRLQEHNRVLEEKVLQRTQDLEAAHNEIVERLALAAEYRDDDTGQ